MAPGIAAALVAAGVDYVVVVRGAIYSAEQTRPDFHQPTGFNVDAAPRPSRAAGRRPGRSCRAPSSTSGRPSGRSVRRSGACAGVEMTRAQIADPDLVAKLRAGRARADPPVHPLQPDVPGARRAQPDRDVHRRADDRDGRPRIPDWYAPAARRRSVAVVGGGPAGLEAARVAAVRGHARDARRARRATRRARRRRRARTRRSSTWLARRGRPARRRRATRRATDVPASADAVGAVHRLAHPGRRAYDIAPGAVRGSTWSTFAVARSPLP